MNSHLRKQLVVLALLFGSSVKCQDATGSTASASSGTSTGGAQPVPPVAATPGVPPGIGGFPGGLGGLPGLGGLAGLFPGLGAGFNKHLDISAGAGAGFAPWLGGLGLGGVAPPVPPVAPVGGIDPALGAGPYGFPGGPFGLLGPSYIPSTWIGSALGAKGDLLFPLVIFVFFVVGVWTIVQFLLGLIVPLIAAKVSVLKGGVDKKFRRALTPQEEKDEQVNHLTNVVWAAFENYGCMKTSACYTGNMVHSIAGADAVKQYEGLLDTMKVMDKEIVKIFKKACETGKEDCSQYPCEAFGQGVKNDQHDNSV